MESFLPSEIARLVLGYLEEHKCEEAYETFLKTSPHLEECFRMREEGRKFRTQVMGLNLLDILYEYSAIFSLIQERLKKVDPETARSLKHSGSLLDKLTFLLNATSSGQTMLFSITLPPGKSPSTVAHVRKRLRTVSNSDKRRDVKKHTRTRIEELSPIVEQGEHARNPSTFETTSLSSLPGNANISLSQIDQFENTEIVKTPKRKSLPLNSSKRSRGHSDVPEESEDNLDLTAITKALLDNHELHEKIAENINKVIRTPELVVGANVPQLHDEYVQNSALIETNTSFSNNFTLELDNAIKKIVQDTESDPIFENFLQEVVCPPDETTSEDGEDRGISDTSTPCQSTPETVKKLSTKHRGRSSKNRSDSPVTSSSEINTPNIIEHQNAAAIESIISMQKNSKESEPSISGLQKKLSNNKENELKKSPAEPVLSTQTTNTQQLTIQTNTIENSTLSQSATPVIITEPLNYQPPIQDNRLVILSSKMTSSGSQVFTVQPAQFQTTTYTEDVLTMPTVIISDENNPNNTIVVPQTMFPNVKPKGLKHPPLILPHPTINTNVTTIPTETMSYTLNVQPIIQSTVSVNTVIKTIDSPKPSTSKSVEPARSVPLIPINSEIKDDKSEEVKPVTPDRSDKKVQLSLSTPRNGRSHIRALDFSTPPKENIQRKSLTSPKVRGVKSARTPKESRSNLFTSPLNLPIATRSPYEKLQGDWDGSEIIFATNKSPRKSRSSERLSSNEGKLNENKPVKRRRVLSMNQVSDKPLIIDEQNDAESIKSEEKKEEEDKSKTKKLSSWDQDLRIHVEPIPLPQRKKKTTNKTGTRKRTKASEQKADIQDTQEIGNKTEEDALRIENELAKTSNNCESSKENVESHISSNIKSNSTEIKSEESKPVKVTKRKRQTKTKTVQKTELVVREKTPEMKKEENENKDELNDDNIQQNKDTECMRNMKPRVNKKCNVGSNTQISPQAQDDKQKSPEEIKAVTVLSPSKMNINKRTLSDQDQEAELKDDKSKPLNIPSKSNNNKSDDQNLITPDITKSTNNYPIKAKCNITPMLETPLKDESSLIPITPKFLTPFGTDVSFTNLIKQNCGSVDLSSIMTPSFPMTPNFPLTPSLATGDTHSSYASRPTDYSNSSSYYQPSDNEQNQKMEQVLIEQAIKMDRSSKKTQIWTSTPDKETILQNSELSIPPNDTMPCTTGDKAKGSALQSNETLEVTKSDVSTSISDHDQTKENTQVGNENTTVIHITPGKLRRGGKHMSVLKELLKPDDGTSESDKSESPESEKSIPLVKKKSDVICNKSEIEGEESISPLKKISTKICDKSESKKDENITESDKIISPLKKKCSTNSNKFETKNDENVTKDEKNISPSKKKSSTVSNKFETKEGKNNTTKEKSEVTISKTENRTKPLGRGRPRKIGNSEEKNTKKEKECTGKKNSIVTKAHCVLLKELEIKRKRVIAGLQDDSVKPKPERKGRGRKKMEVSTRITRSKSVNRTRSSEKKSEEIERKPKQPVTRRKSIKKTASIEDVAERLKKDKNNKSEVKISGFKDVPNNSFESQDSSFSKDKPMTPATEDEDTFRLHISSDEELIETVKPVHEGEDSDLVKDLKERGIHLIPKKPTDKIHDLQLKDEDNPNIINKQELDLEITSKKGKELELSVDIEENIPETRIEKIKIKSDIYLEESKKIDVSKILSQSITTDKILGKDDKKASKIVGKSEISKTGTENKIIEDEVVTSEAEQTNNNKKPDTVEICDKSKLTETKEIEQIKDISKELLSTNSTILPEFDEEFHVKIVTEDSPEYIQIIHDESIQIKKTIEDYNFAVLKKQISAKVFLEELNIEQDRVLSVTPYIDFITFPAKIPKIILKPLEILFNEIVDDSSLDTLFGEKPLDKSPITMISQKSKDIINIPEKPVSKPNLREKSDSSPKSGTSTSSPKVTKRIISWEQYKNKPNKKTKEYQETIKSRDTKEHHTEEDELMTFALTGGNKDTPLSELNPKKRKLESDSTKLVEKKMKPNDKHALLKSLDVDQFLSILHGPSNRET